MKNKNYILTTIPLLLLILFTFGNLSQNTLAQTSSVSIDIENPLGETSDIYTLVMKILNFLIILAAPLTAILVIYAGFLYITSAGNEEKIKTAQKTLIWALIGFAVVLIATGVPALIKKFLGATGCSTDEECDGYEKCSNQKCIDVCEGIACTNTTSCVPIGNHEYECRSGVVPQI